MASSADFRRQADFYLQLARTLSDPKAVAALIAIAQDFIVKANQIDQAEQSDRRSGPAPELAPSQAANAARPES